MVGHNCIPEVLQTYIDTYIHTYIHTYIQRYAKLNATGLGCLASRSAINYIQYANSVHLSHNT